MLTEKYSCRKIVFIGGIICSTGMVLSSFSQSLFHLYLTGGLLTGNLIFFTYRVLDVILNFDKNYEQS